MAVTLTPTSIVVKGKLNNGTTATGAIKTVSVPIGGSSQKIDINAYMTDISTARQHAINIADAMDTVLSKTTIALSETTEGNLA